MNKVDRKVFFGAATQNFSAVLLHAGLGALLLLSTIGFSSLIALYFGHDVVNLRGNEKLGWLVGTPSHILLAATLAATVGLASRIWQTILEARVVVGRERWFADKLRADERTPSVVGNIPRASNYYGRLSGAAMKAVSTGVILLLNIIGIIILIPKNTAAVAFAGLSLIAVLLYVAMRHLSTAMSSSSSNLAANAKSASNWKSIPSLEADEKVDAYFKAYFYRIFLASSFGFAAPLFGIVFCLIILSLRELINVEFSFAQAFVAFAVMQAYVGLMGNLFGSLVHGAAFLPAVKPYIDPASSAEYAAPSEISAIADDLD